ncbi:MAG: hypothetical protein ACI3XL_02640 [Eubacteriales bacterium]
MNKTDCRERQGYFSFPFSSAYKGTPECENGKSKSAREYLDDISVPFS